MPDTPSPRPSLLRRLRALPARLGPLWWYGALLFCANRLGDAVNLYAGACLIPARVSAERLGAVRPLLLLAALLATPAGFLVTPAEKFFNVFHERRQYGRAKALLRDATLAVCGLVAVSAAVLAVRPGPILERLRLDLDDRVLLVLTVLLGATGSLRPLVQAAARAFQRFAAVVWSGVPGSFVRLAVLWALLGTWPLRGYLCAQIAADAACIAIALAAAVRFLRVRAARCESYRDARGEMARFAAPLVLCNLLGTGQAFVEAFVIRQRLPASDSAADYFVQMLAMLPFYFGDAIAAFLFPILSSRHESGRDTGRMLRQAMAGSLAIGLGCTALLAVVSPWVLSLRPDWVLAQPFAWLVAVVALGKTFRMVANCFLLREQACRRFGFLWHYAPILAVSSLGLYALEGWDFFRPLLPARLWARVAAWPRASLPFILCWGVAWNAAVLAAVLLHGVLRRHRGRLRPPHPDPSAITD